MTPVGQGGMERRDDRKFVCAAAVLFLAGAVGLPLVLLVADAGGAPPVIQGTSAELLVPSDSSHGSSWTGGNSSGSGGGSGSGEESSALSSSDAKDTPSQKTIDWSLSTGTDPCSEVTVSGKREYRGCEVTVNTRSLPATMRRHGWKIRNLLGKGAFGNVFKITTKRGGKTRVEALKVAIPDDKKRNAYRQRTRKLTDPWVKSKTLMIREQAVFRGVQSQKSKHLCYSTKSGYLRVRMKWEGKQVEKWMPFQRMPYYASGTLGHSKGPWKGSREDLDFALWHAIMGIRDMNRAGYAHVDVKPPNMLRTTVGGQPESHRTVVCDFGLARRVGGNTMCNAGTPGYKAPEVEMCNGVRKKKYAKFCGRHGALTVQIDVWSLGALIATLGELSKADRYQIPAFSRFEKGSWGRLQKKQKHPHVDMDKQDVNALFDDVASAARAAAEGWNASEPVSGLRYKIIARALVVNPDERINIEELEDQWLRYLQALLPQGPLREQMEHDMSERKHYLANVRRKFL